MSEPEPRLPRSTLDVIVCSRCRKKIPAGAPKQSKGSGWICQECAYELAMGSQLHDLPGVTFEDMFK